MKGTELATFATPCVLFCWQQ